jgi:formylglycine-generating enzyme required for sulfatase activity/class 3 adenylate cyclase
MKIREDDIDQLLQARKEIDEELRRHKTRQTVLFTDIVGSTTYFDRFGDTEGLLLLYRHDSLVKGTVEEYSGIVVKTIGDSVMAEFADPLSAVLAAIAIQRLLVHHNQSLARSERLQIRVGIHTGYGFKRANDLFGDIVNVAARITKRSGPAQILVSHPVMEAIPASEVFFKSLGEVALDGKSDAEELFEVYWTEAVEYDAIRRILTPMSDSGDRASGFVSAVGHGISQLYVSASRALQWLDFSAGRLVMKLHATSAVAFVKAAMVVAVYLTIAAGMVWSRADTKQPAIAPAVPVANPLETPVEAVIASPPVAVEETETSNAAPSADGNALTENSSLIPDPVQPPVEQVVAAVIEPLPVDRRPWTSLIDTVLVPAGTFMMGDDSGKGDEKPRHQVMLDRFNMSRTEITNRQYLAFLADTGYPRPKDPGYAKNYLLDYPALPVINVSYEDAMAFCEWASTKFNATVRLPTEAEWEYAATADKNGAPYPWGPLDPKSMARFKGNAPDGVRTASKEDFPPNRFGLYNMSGNVWEWVQDHYAKDYYVTSPIRNPKGPVAGTKRSIRGGSWANGNATLRVTRRSSRNPTDRNDQTGFRVVVTSAASLSDFRGRR